LSKEDSIIKDKMDWANEEFNKFLSQLFSPTLVFSVLYFFAKYLGNKVLEYMNKFTQFMQSTSDNLKTLNNRIDEIYNLVNKKRRS